MLGIVLELVLSYVQFSSTILVPSGTAGARAEVFPSEWQDPMFYMSFLNLGHNIITDIIRSLDDLRVYFMVICVVLPLSMNFFGLFFLNTQRVVLWYFFMLGFFLALCVGAFARAIRSTIDVNITDQVAEILLFVGLGGTVLCWILFLCAYRGCFGQLTSEGDEKVNRRRKMRKDTAVIDRRRTLGLLFMLGVWLVLGFLFIGVIPEVHNEIDSKVTANFALGLGVVCFILAFGNLIFLVLSLFQGGRELSWRFKEYMRHMFLTILLLSLSMLYIPIGASTFTVFNCNTITCPIGFRLPSQGMSVSINETFGGKCIPCHVAPGQMCPADIQTTMCQGMIADRLETDLFIGCEGMRNFFWPAGIIVIAFFLLGVPLLFFFEIRTSTRLLMDDFPIKEPVRDEGETQGDYEQRRWELKVLMCDNSARFLFEAFEFRFRYMRLMQLIQKLIVVFTSVFVIRYGDLSPRYVVLGTSLVVHFLVTAVFVIFRPFLLNLHDWVATVLQACLCILIIVAFIVAAEIEVPSGVLTATMVFNYAVPALSVLFSLFYYCFSVQKEAEEAEAEMKRRAEAEACDGGAGMLPPVKSRPDGQSSGKYVVDLDGVPGDLDGGPAQPQLARSKSIVARKEERERVRRMNIREKVRQQIQDEMDALKDQQMDSDVHIDQRMQKQLRVYLMVGGVLATIALGLCVLGLWSVKHPDVRTSRESPMTSRSQLAGYASWSNFTTSCCCASTTSAYTPGTRKTSPIDVELWMCKSGAIQERIRSNVVFNETNDASHFVDGFNMRPLCGTTFSNGCELLSSEGSENLVLQCPTGVAVAPDLW